jgi:holin-like protein
MKLLRQLGIILSIALLGEFISKTTNLPIPGNVLGMIILLILLCLKIVKIEMIDEMSTFLLGYLGFFFIPAGVGLIASLDLLKGKWIAILAICLISTFTAIVVTGLTIQFVKRRHGNSN